MTTGKRGELQGLIRPATAADAFELADIRTAAHTTNGEPTSGELAIREALDFIDRLSLPHGDDYFCIVAEQQGAITGHLIGGGSRDLDRKAHGEIYEIVVLPDSRRQGIGRALLGNALDRFDAAAFAGTLMSAPAEDRAVARLALGLGMLEESVRGPEGSIVRYERALHGGKAS